MALVYLSSQTASSSASLSFTSGIDSTYDAYEFHFINVQPYSYAPRFTFQVNRAGQTGYNESMTSTYFLAYNLESGSPHYFYYDSSNDQSNGTAYQSLTGNLQNNNDDGLSGVLTLYAPSSTTYLKQWICRINSVNTSPQTQDSFIAGYIQSTPAIDEISFQMSSGNIYLGTIHMYGVK